MSDRPEPMHARVIDFASIALLLLGVTSLVLGGVVVGFEMGVDRGASSAAAALRWCGPCRWAP